MCKGGGMKQLGVFRELHMAPWLHVDGGQRVKPGGAKPAQGRQSRAQVQVTQGCGVWTFP